MLTYIVLASFTDQGIRTVKDTTKRADAAKDLAGRFGVKMREIYWTQGQYDLVTLCEAGDEAFFDLGVGEFTDFVVAGGVPRQVNERVSADLRRIDERRHLDHRRVGQAGVGDVRDVVVCQWSTQEH